MSHPSDVPGPEIRISAAPIGAAAQPGSQPLTCGIPWPRGALRDAVCLTLLDGSNQSVPLQTRALDHWVDGSIRWTLLDWQGDASASATYRIQRTSGKESAVAGCAIHIEERGRDVVVNTQVARFEIGAGTAFPFQSVMVRDRHAVDATRTGLTAEDEHGRSYRGVVDQVELTDSGAVRAVVRTRGNLVDQTGNVLTEFDAWLHFFAGSAVVRFELTIRNSRKAEHPGGMWDLGSGGSIYLRDASLTIALPPGAGDVHVHCSTDAETPFGLMELPLEIYQDSSGGENWKSSNHLNRRRSVPNSFRGYRLRAGRTERHGLRATPALSLQRGEQTLGLTMPYFWQHFPKAVEASADGALVLRLFPHQYSDVHEIQGGEQKTHSFSVLFGSDGPTEQILRWCRSPALPSASPQWYCASGALPYLTPKADDPNETYLKLVDAAIAGDDTFDLKREVIDEYGWRHFGDIYGDHEAVFHKGPPPLVSHYNNQYDPIAGFAYQFLRSGDSRWWRHMHELAMHVYDIDIYHTDKDKAAYNHGLFWHTFHYVDAGTATHRTYPKAAKVPGGGPANEQNYATGLMLHHFLTGDPRSREAAIGLARWVVDMDDGDKTIFRWLARGYTGLASSSRTPDYHGPGRGGANSITVLLDGHRLTGDPAFLTKAEQLMRRCIHPADDVPARNLIDAENRWFYTMFLQSLGKYLDYKIELGQLDDKYAYARASLLHYVRWMAECEYPYLDKPDILEYPTETWAAQDMRKSEIFKYAAKHAVGEERTRFLARSEFFFRYSINTLNGMKTRSFCRPVVLLLSFGFMHAYFQHHPETSAPPPSESHLDFGMPMIFIPQKVLAKKRFRILAAIGVALTAVAIVTGVVYWLAR